MADPPAGLVVVNVHEHACQSVRVSWVVLLAFPHVDEALSEPVRVVSVVAAAAPHPFTHTAAVATAAATMSLRALLCVYR